MKSSLSRILSPFASVVVLILLHSPSGFTQIPSQTPVAAPPSVQSGFGSNPVVVNSSTEVEMERLRLAEEIRKMERDELRFKEQIILLQKKLAMASGTALAPKELTMGYRTFISANPGDIETSEKYYALLKSTLNDLVPKSPYKETSFNDAKSDPRNAEQKLHQLSQFEEDDRISQTIKAQMASIRSGSKGDHTRKNDIVKELAFLEKEKKRLVGNYSVASTPSRVTGRLLNNPATLALMQHEILETQEKINNLRKEQMGTAGTGDLRRKLQFQQLIIQLAGQQRYMHSLIACGFYRLFTSDMGMMPEAYPPKGDKKKTAGSGGSGFSKPDASVGKDQAPKVAGADLPFAATITGLETILLNRMRDAMRERNAIDNMLKANQLSAAERLLLKMITVAKYQPELHTIPHADRQRIQKQSGNIKKLSDALTSRNYDEMMKLAEEIEKSGSEVGMGDIKTFAQEHPRKALFWANQAELALDHGNHKAMQTMMEAAMRQAPLDDKVKAKIEELQGDVVSKKDSLDELKRIVKNGDYRQAFDRKTEFSSLANTSSESTLKADFEALIDLETEVETALKTCDGFEDRSSYPDAWIALEECDTAIEEDPRLLKRRLDVSSKCPNFVSAYTNALEHEEKGNTALALAWYLTARTDAPSTPKIKQRIDELGAKILK